MGLSFRSSNTVVTMSVESDMLVSSSFIYNIIAKLKHF